MSTFQFVSESTSYAAEEKQLTEGVITVLQEVCVILRYSENLLQKKESEMRLKKVQWLLYFVFVLCHSFCNAQPVNLLDVLQANSDEFDYFGYSVSISGDTVVVGAILESSNATGVNGDQNNNNAPGSGAAYVFVRNGRRWSQQAYLKASNTQAEYIYGGSGDQFGYSVSISGDTIVVGAPLEDSYAPGVNGDQNNNRGTNSGAAYVFVRSGTMWTQQAYLKGSNTEVGDNFGWSVSISGDTIVVGARLESSNATGVNGDQDNDDARSSGAAYVFVRDGTTWTQQAFLKASNTQIADGFGYSVSISGDTIVVGADKEDSNATGVNGDESNDAASDSGAAYVFVRSGTVWTQQAYLKASNTQPRAEFGYSVCISGDTIVVGAHQETVNGEFNSGAAYVFVRNNATWIQQVHLKASNAQSTDQFGISVSISGDIIVVGASGEDSNATGVNGDQNNNNAPQSGAAYLYVRDGAIWTQQAYLKASVLSGRYFGKAVAVDELVIVGQYIGNNVYAFGVNATSTTSYDTTGTSTVINPTESNGVTAAATSSETSLENTSDDVDSVTIVAVGVSVMMLVILIVVVGLVLLRIRLNNGKIHT